MIKYTKCAINLIFFKLMLIAFFAINLSAAFSQELNNFKPKFNTETVAFFKRSISACKSLIRDRASNPDIRITEPCADDKGNWNGVEKVSEGFRFQLNVTHKKNEKAALWNALLGETVRVTCSVDLHGVIFDFSDHKESISELGSRPYCGQLN